MLCGVALFAASSASYADDGDLDRIPQSVPVPPAGDSASPARQGQKLYLQDDFTLSATRGNLAVPVPASPAGSWEERLFFDARIQEALTDDVHLTYSGRLNLRAEDGLPFPDHEDVRHDLRELYLNWQPDDGTFVDVGRINLKSGAALGFNPTDFFKTRAVVEPLSSDPTALREDRLGTLMILGERIFQGGAVTVAFAPRVTSESPVYTNSDLKSFDPMLDRTNAKTRLLVKATFNIADDLAPEFLFYLEDGRTAFGASLTRGLGQAIVAYLEWSGSDRASLIDDALRFGRQTGTLPLLLPPVIPDSSSHSFQNDVSLGASYTTESKITFNLEYHFHQAGFSNTDWRNWFSVGEANAHVAPVIGELWYIRSYAAEQQEPLARNGAFLRADWQDAFVRDLELTGLVSADLRDGSGFAQVTANYYVSGDWTVGGLASATFGGRRSDFGSLPAAASVMVKASRYF